MTPDQKVDEFMEALTDYMDARAQAGEASKVLCIEHRIRLRKAVASLVHFHRTAADVMMGYKNP